MEAPREEAIQSLTCRKAENIFSIAPAIGTF
jgi:hypothetical protein